MAQEIDTTPIIDAFTSGEISASQAVAALQKMGVDKKRAQYVIKTMETVDVI
jgi:hypothetical protein